MKNTKSRIQGKLITRRFAKDPEEKCSSSTVSIRNQKYTNTTDPIGVNIPLKENIYKMQIGDLLRRNKRDELLSLEKC